MVPPTPPNIPTPPTSHHKLYVALAGGVVTVASLLLGLDNTLVVALIQLLTAAGVYAIPNQIVY